MKKTALISAFLFCCIGLSAQVRFEYDVRFDLRFDNREYDRSGFQSSLTMFGARLEPTIGFSAEAGKTRHELMAGVDMLKEFGTSDKEILCNLQVWYRFGMPMGETYFNIAAGVLPRRFSKGEWSQAFFSDYYIFHDNSIEGIIFSWDNPKYYFELGCDWNGMLKESRREEFFIFTSGRYMPSKWFRLGWEAYMHHYSCSEQASGVVDDILAEPYVRFDFAPFAGIQDLSLKLGWIQSLQRDRKFVGNFVAPYAGEVIATVQNWGVGISNRFVAGRNLQPYWYSTDDTGQIYASGLYHGDPFYQMADPRSSNWTSTVPATTSDIPSGVYDRLEIYYAPKIVKGLSIKASVFFHFHRRQYSGTNQAVSIVFDLHDLMQEINARKLNSGQ
ncbi:MAG: hypothetical protein ACI39U_05810 [Candidatus Cryptobacteroides sp.]